MKPIALGLLWLAAAAAAAADAPSSAPSCWWLIQAADGGVMGHASEEVVATPEGRRIVDSQDLYLVDPDSPDALRIVSRTVVTQDGAGRTVRIESSARSGEDWSLSQARIGADRAEVERATPADRRTTIVVLPRDVRFDEGEPLLEAWDPARSPRIEFRRFDVDAAAVERVVIEAAPGASPDALGRITLLRRSYDGDQLVGLAKLVLDRDRRVVETDRPMFGTTIAMRPTDRETALAPHPPFAVVPASMKRSPYLISDPAARRRLRYKFGFVEGLAFPLPETSEQRVSAAPDGVVVDICEGCGPGLPADKVALADALKPTAWMQSDAPKLKALAAPVARLSIPDAEKMKLLQKTAASFFDRVDFVGHYSALETLKRRSGDCTEAAVLLGALGRAAGIPTKVVNGLVYSRESYHGVANAFLPHSWTLAYVDGRWESFDMALDVFDSTHIALTIGDGDARSVAAANQLAGLLVWREMAEVRTRPAT